MMRKALVVGWASFVDGEATAGDVLSMRAAQRWLAASGIPAEIAWSPGLTPTGPALDEVNPRDYTDLVFACGPLHGSQVRALHERFAHCRRVAIGVSVLNWQDPAVTGFHRVLARDGAGVPTHVDLAAGEPVDTVPLVGVLLAPGQPEYGDLRAHEHVHATVQDWLAHADCARLRLDTRLDPSAWRDGYPNQVTAEQLVSVFARCDALISTRLHGLVLGLTARVPVIAVDPVAGGGKVSAQAHAWSWPALLDPETVRVDRVHAWWQWTRTPHARKLAARAARVAEAAGTPAIPATEVLDSPR